MQEVSSGTLYVLASPIGNLGDLSHRAQALLGQVELILCEDTRRTRKLLAHYQVRRPLEAYHAFNEVQRAAELADRLESGTCMALVSDAGTPTLSDPGYRLVLDCRRRGIPVIPVPGPSAVVTALSVSGLPTDEFHFVGFLPARKDARRRKIASLCDLEATLVFYEAPHRLLASLADLQEVLGDRRAFLGREMTKLHEEYLFGRISEILPRVRERGEIVIVLEGRRGNAPAAGRGDEPLVLETLSRNELLRTIAARLGVSRRRLYEALYRKESEE